MLRELSRQVYTHVILRTSNRYVNTLWDRRHNPGFAPSSVALPFWLLLNIIPRIFHHGTEFGIVQQSIARERNVEAQNFTVMHSPKPDLDPTMDVDTMVEPGRKGHWESSRAPSRSWVSDVSRDQFMHALTVFYAERQ
jgi:hypothetical protein